MQYTTKTAEMIGRFTGRNAARTVNVLEEMTDYLFFQELQSLVQAIIRGLLQGFALGVLSILLTLLLDLIVGVLIG